uniref:Uncharacterized protein n=1 Tax=Romanomermis culicivorax TaxID=13658 RepID=A0A915IG98_ROMCU
VHLTKNYYLPSTANWEKGAKSSANDKLFFSKHFSTSKLVIKATTGDKQSLRKTDVDSRTTSLAVGDVIGRNVHFTKKTQNVEKITKKGRRMRRPRDCLTDLDRRPRGRLAEIYVFGLIPALLYS